jgi:tetratricopeptide (TPR) repeat protein
MIQPSIYAQAANALPKDLGLQLSAAQAEIAAGASRRRTHFSSAPPSTPTTIGCTQSAERLPSSRSAIRMPFGNTAPLSLTCPQAAEGPLYGIQLHMDLMEVYKNLADESAAHHELDTAQAEINALGDQASGRAQFLRLRALIRMDAGNLDAALKDIKEALAINAHDRDDLQLDGDILMKLGRTEDAIGVYKQILAVDRSTGLRLLPSVMLHARRGATRMLKSISCAWLQPILRCTPLSCARRPLHRRREFTKARGLVQQGVCTGSAKALILAGGMNAAIEAHDLDLAGTG